MTQNTSILSGLFAAWRVRQHEKYRQRIYAHQLMEAQALSLRTGSPYHFALDAIAANIWWEKQLFGQPLVLTQSPSTASSN